MIQVRCPECGYLQTLSEERFLTISENFLNCPHCHARVPKQWSPAPGDSVPEEARHKILAFSRRILNGGEVGREVVRALESLVRRHGALEMSNKALGMGYAGLGDIRKAEEFLLLGLSEAPDDLEVHRCLVGVFLAGKKFTEAHEAAHVVMDSVGAGVLDEDVAMAAQALIGLGKLEEARVLLESYPKLDQRNSAVKKSQKMLLRYSGTGLASVIAAKIPLKKLLSKTGKGRIKSLTNAARDFIRPNTHSLPSSEVPSVPLAHADGTREEARKNERSILRKAKLECWIYTTHKHIPRWDQVRRSLVQQYEQESEREQAIKFLETLIEKNRLMIEYVVKDDASELFYYPEDLIPQNSRGVTDEERRSLLKAEMIVRIGLSHQESPIMNGLTFMTNFVESVRVLIGGVVQDAMSHILWGTQEWINHAVNPHGNILDSEVNIHVLDEGQTVWIHSHGMAKFGLPDLELEGIPSELAPGARKFVLLAATTLINASGLMLKSHVPIGIPNTSLSFTLEIRQPDEEGHFAGGSIRIVPFMSGHDPHDKNGTNEILRAVQAYQVPNLILNTPMPEKQPPDERESQREKFLSAHKKARKNLPVFKRSFRNRGDVAKQVHAVKVGFAIRDGGYEWMWVALDTWRGSSLEGLLKNSPVLVKELHEGSRVQLNDTDIFDWVIVNNGNVLDGGFTEKMTAS